MNQVHCGLGHLAVEAISLEAIRPLLEAFTRAYPTLREVSVESIKKWQRGEEVPSHLKSKVMAVRDATGKNIKVHLTSSRKNREMIIETSIRKVIVIVNFTPPSVNVAYGILKALEQLKGAYIKRAHTYLVIRKFTPEGEYMGQEIVPWY